MSIWQDRRRYLVSTGLVRGSCCPGWAKLMGRRIDEDKARKAREDMIRKKVVYGHSVPYRNMCRFQSGVSSAWRSTESEAHASAALLQTSFIDEIRLLLACRVSYTSNFETAMLIPLRPSVRYFCDLSQSRTWNTLTELTFTTQHTTLSLSCRMRRKSTVSRYLSSNTSRPSLHYGRPSRVSSLVHNFEHKLMQPIEFLDIHPEYLAKDNAMAFLSDDNGVTYNKCHCEWSPALEVATDGCSLVKL